MKRPALGKRKRVTPPPSEADQPDQPDELPDTQPSDPGDTATQPEDTEELEEATQDNQSHGEYKKRLMRMTDAQEDEMAKWLKNHPEVYNKGKEYRDMDRKEAAWATQARTIGMAGEFQLLLYY